MSRPKLKGETGTIRVSLRFKEKITRGAKGECLSTPDYVDKHLLEKV